MLKYFLPFFCLFVFTAAAQDSLYRKAVWQAGEPVFPVTRNRCWSLINRTGEEVIEPKFRNVGYFANSLFPARLDGL